MTKESGCEQAYLLVSVSLCCICFLCGCRDGRSRADTGQTHEIISSSMDPAFRGRHMLVRCDDCQHQFRVDPEFAPAEAGCPGCGVTIEVKGPINHGDLVDFTQIDSGEEGHERLGVVVFKPESSDAVSSSQEASSLLTVKRVWGLPGEQIHFADGDLFVDGVRFQKSLGQLANVAVPICSLSKNVQFWMRSDAQRDSSEYLRSLNAGVDLVSGESLVLEDKQQLDGVAFPLFVDRYQSNTGVRRGFHRVQDVGVCVSLLKALQDDELLVVRIGDQTAEISNGQLSGGRQAIQQFTVAICDQRLLVGFNAQHENTLAMPIKSSFVDAVEVLVRNGAVTVTETKVFRDLQLALDDRGNGGAKDWRIELGSDEYCVLGDNLPVSVDSRQFGPISGGQILGQITDSKSVFGFR